MTAPWPILLMARQLDIGGSERQLCETARTLDRARFCPHIACFQARGLRVAEMRASGVPVLDLGLASLVGPSLLAAAGRLGRYLAAHRIQLLHAFDVPANLFGVPAARAWRVPLVLSSQRAHRELTGTLRRHLLRLTDQLVDGIVVNCQAVRRQLIEQDRVPPPLIRVCYNGVDTARFQPGPRCRPAGLQDAALVIGTVGAFRPEKDLATLVEAFARLEPAAAGLKLLLVGGGPCLEPLRALAARRGLERDCRFEPAAAEVRPWLDAIDIFVLPSRSEALSNALLEAMACGCAAVASRVGGNPEIVQHERTGLLFEPGHPAALAAALARLIGNAAERAALAAAGADSVRSRFSRETSVRRMEELYLDLLAARHSTA